MKWIFIEEVTVKYFYQCTNFLESLALFILLSNGFCFSLSCNQTRHFLEITTKSVVRYAFQIAPMVTLKISFLLYCNSPLKEDITLARYKDIAVSKPQIIRFTQLSLSWTNIGQPYCCSDSGEIRSLYFFGIVIRRRLTKLFCHNLYETTDSEFLNAQQN